MEESENRVESVSRILLKCIGIDSNTDFAELDFGDDDEIEYHESGFT